MMVLPPSEPGALQLTTAEVTPGVAETPVGGSGAVAGTTADEADEEFPVPLEFVAVTVNV
jgi:hypothetical protein